MILIVGIGNHGKEFDKTRHNVGFMAIDRLADKLGVVFEEKFCSKVAFCFIEGKKVCLMKPSTYVNLSGRAVSMWKSFFKEQITNIFVIYDDATLLLGKIKVALGGGSGGHNGIKSITSSVGEGYYRIKVGIGITTDSLERFVLGKFSENELAEIGKAIDYVIKRMPILLAGGENAISNFMNKEYNPIDFIG